MSLKIVTDDKGILVFRKDKEWQGGSFPVYSTSVSSKNKNGEYVNAYIDLKFKKGTDITNKTVIKIENAFPVVDEWNDNKKISYFVSEYEVVKEGETPAQNNSDWASIPDDSELPFAAPTR